MTNEQWAQVEGVPQNAKRSGNYARECRRLWQILNFTSMSNLKHFDDWGTVRFVTFSCHERLPLLSHHETASLLLQQVSWARKHYALRLFGYVVMPEHVHLVIWPELRIKLGTVIGNIKWKSSRDIIDFFGMNLPGTLSKLIVNTGKKNPGRWRVLGHPDSGEGQPKFRVWLPRCYDHNCRNRETVIEKINYCHWNPVKRGLVTRPEDWKWSSYRWYAGLADNVIDIDPLIF